MISPCGYSVAELEAMRQERMRDPEYAKWAAREAAKWERLRVAHRASVDRARAAARGDA